MEACPDTHPTLTSCLGPFGISGTSCPPKPSFLGNSWKGQEKSQAAGCGRDTAGSAHQRSVSVTQPWCQDLSGHQTQKKNSLQLSCLLLLSYSWRHQGVARAFILWCVDAKGLVHRKRVPWSVQPTLWHEGLFSTSRRGLVPKHKDRYPLHWAQDMGQALLKHYNFKSALVSCFCQCWAAWHWAGGAAVGGMQLVPTSVWGHATSLGPLAPSSRCWKISGAEEKAKLCGTLLVDPGRCCSGLQQKLMYARQEGPKHHQGISTSLYKIPEVQGGFAFPKTRINQLHLAMGRMLLLIRAGGVSPCSPCPVRDWADRRLGGNDAISEGAVSWVPHLGLRRLWPHNKRSWQGRAQSSPYVQNERKVGFHAIGSQGGKLSLYKCKRSEVWAPLGVALCSRETFCLITRCSVLGFFLLIEEMSALWLSIEAENETHLNIIPLLGITE